jgi:hypothetical protein
MNKIAATFLLGTASAILFSASFLTTDAAGYMDWAKESAPAIHQEMKSFKSSLPFHSIKEDKEGSHDRKDKVKKERKEKDGRQRKDRGHDEENRSHDRIHSEAHRQDERDNQRSMKQDYRKGNPSAPASPAPQETAPMTPEEPQPQTSPDAG